MEVLQKCPVKMTHKESEEIFNISIDRYKFQIKFPITRIKELKLQMYQGSKMAVGKSKKILVRNGDFTQGKF